MTPIGAPPSTVLGACGGGGIDDFPQQTRLVCPSTCTSSSTLATGKIRPTFTVVDDGAGVTGTAGFSTGSDSRNNVELDGDDSLKLASSQSVQVFHLPPMTIVFDALAALLFGAPPYVSDAMPSTGALPVQFQFVRGSTTYLSNAMLPAAFRLALPTGGASLPLTARTLQVRLTPAIAAMPTDAAFKCTDANGNTGTGNSTLPVVANSGVVDATGTSYAVDTTAAINGLTFTTTFARAAITGCDVTLTVSQQSTGVADARFESGRVVARQARTVNVSMR